ncbi:hypothetical protein [Lachnotalea glycerini]|nr:hypothetical protein [Lachnotalea glycerini]RDY31804.1 Hpt domain-containing protein [Lachnotalea glycerini]
MEESYKRQLVEIGIEVKNTLERFMNREDLYEKFLVKFLDDKNFILLKKNLEIKNYEEAFINAHTLKGVTANLGLRSLYDPLVFLVEELRQSKFECANYFTILQDRYDELCNVIRENSKLLLTR